MENYLSYILQVNIGIVLFYAGYMALLKNETHFQLNRWYLLGGLLLPFAIPFLLVSEKINTAVSPITLSIFDVGTANTIIEGTKSTIMFSFSLLLVITLAIGTAIGLFKCGVEIFKIVKTIKQNKRQQEEGYTIVKVGTTIPPASFFNYIFLPINTSEDTKSILQHELVHAKQLHSLDVLLVQFIKALFWFNPLLLFYKKAIEETHEFIADENAIDHNISTQQYSKILLGQTLGVAPLLLTNSFFNQSLLKRRIKMIHKTKSKKMAQLKYAVAIPVLAAVLFAAACTKNEVSTDETSEVTQEEVFTVTEVMPEFPGGEKELLAYLGNNIKYPANAKENGVEGTVYVNFIVDEKGDVTKEKVMKGVSEELDAEALRVIKNMPSWEPGEQDGEKVKVSYNIPIKYALK